MALGEIENIKERIFAASSPKLDAMFSHLSSAKRDEAVGWLHDLKVGLSEYYSDKLSYYKALPWKAAGLDGRRVGNYSGAVALAGQIEKECEEMVTGGAMERAHRETVYFWDTHNHTLKKWHGVT